MADISEIAMESGADKYQSLMKIVEENFNGMKQGVIGAGTLYEWEVIDGTALGK